MRTAPVRSFLAGLAVVIVGGLLPAPSASAATTIAATTSRTAIGASVLAAAKRPSKVTVPSEYVYDPKLGVLHDYCTHAPDEFPAPKAANADFRGPCARHDLCYAGSDSRKTCDKALRRNLFRNCNHYYGRYNPLRAACKATALIYWAAVVAT
jgi:hypothetical protein